MTSDSSDSVTKWGKRGDLLCNWNILVVKWSLFDMEAGSWTLKWRSESWVFLEAWRNHARCYGIFRFVPSFELAHFQCLPNWDPVTSGGFSNRDTKQYRNSLFSDIDTKNRNLKCLDLRWCTQTLLFRMDNKFKIHVVQSINFIGVKVMEPRNHVLHILEFSDNCNKLLVEILFPTFWLKRGWKLLLMMLKGFCGLI